MPQPAAQYAHWHYRHTYSVHYSLYVRLSRAYRHCELEDVRQRGPGGECTRSHWHGSPKVHFDGGCIARYAFFVTRLPIWAGADLVRHVARPLTARSFFKSSQTI